MWILACPLCDSETAGQVRAGLVDANLPLAIAGTLVPFAVVALVVAAVHFGPPWGWRKR